MSMSIISHGSHTLKHYSKTCLSLWGLPVLISTVQQGQEWKILSFLCTNKGFMMRLLCFPYGDQLSILKFHLPRKLRQNKTMGAKVMWALERTAQAGRTYSDACKQLSAEVSQGQTLFVKDFTSLRSCHKHGRFHSC